VKVKIRPPAEMEIVFSMNAEEITELYEATRPGRRTRRQQQVLEHLGDLVLEAGSPAT
jgi:NTP pyrophosphatase (non-canonical NTP hydrolase)